MNIALLRGSEPIRRPPHGPSSSARTEPAMKPQGRDTDREASPLNVPHTRTTPCPKSSAPALGRAARWSEPGKHPHRGAGAPRARQSTRRCGRRFSAVPAEAHRGGRDVVGERPLGGPCHSTLSGDTRSPVSRLLVGDCDPGRPVGMDGCGKLSGAEPPSGWSRPLLRRPLGHRRRPPAGTTRRPIPSTGAFTNRQAAIEWDRSMRTIRQAWESPSARACATARRAHRPRMLSRRHEHGPVIPRCRPRRRASTAP